MKRDSHLEIAWPTLVGVMIGVELMLSALWLFGPAIVPSSVLATLTQRGLQLFRPEHDLFLYVSGCALACSLCIGLAWLQSRRRPSEQASASPASIQFRWEQIVLCALLFALHLFVLIATQRYFRGSDDIGDMPLFAAALLFVLPLFSFCVVIFEWRLPCHPYPTRSGFSSEDIPSPPYAAWFSGWDLLIAPLICGVLYIPKFSNLAGEFLLLEKLHHWDFYAMGPTLAFHHGRALGTDFYTQYGVGWPLLFDALAQHVAISYGHMIQLSVIYCCLYFFNVYILLKGLLRNRIWAVAGLFLVLALHLFSGTGSDVLWRYPSSTILRSPLDVWFFICILFHVRTARAVWLRLAAALAGGAILFGTDTGLYLSATLAAYFLYCHSLPRTKARLPLRQLSLALQCVALALAVSLPMLWIAGRGTLLQSAFWSGWLESFLAYGGGFGALPIALVPPSTLLLFALVLVLYLSMICVSLLKLPLRNNTPENVFLACLSTYGLATLMLFIGRSHPYNLFHVSVPFSIVAAVTFARWSQSRVQSLTDASQRATPPTGQVLSLGTYLPLGALVAATLFLVTTTSFRKYPGFLQSFFLAKQPAGFCLLKEEKDLSGLPAEAKEYAAMFDAVINRLKEAAASGKTVAVLDDADPIFYLASDTAPWSRYSPLFPMLYTHALVDQLVSQVAERGPDVVVIRSNLIQSDVWRAFHETVEKHYRLDGTAGVFEFWQRNR